MKSQFLHFRKYAAIGLLAYAASWGPLASAQTPLPPVVVVDSLPIDQSTAYQFTATDWRGPIFQTGAVPTLIHEISFGFDIGVAATATLSLYQLDNTTNFPIGTALASSSIDIQGTSAVTDVNTYSAAQLGAIAATTLQAGQKYALILSNPSDPVGLTNEDDINNAYIFSGGFAAAGIGYVQSIDSGADWEVGGGTPAFRLTVQAFDENIEIVPRDPEPPTPVPGLGAVGVVSLVSIMGWLGMRRARTSPGRRS